MLWGEVLEYWARWQPDKVGLKFEERDFTWADLDRRADELAAGLSNLGVGRGDRVGHPAHEPARVRRDGDGLHEARRHRRADQRAVHPARAGLRDRQRRLLGGGDRAGPGRRACRRTAEERPGMPILDADDGTLDEARVAGGRPPGRDGARRPAVHLLHERHHRRPQGRGAHPPSRGTTRPCAGRSRAASTSTTACCCPSRWPSPGPGDDADGAVVGFDAGAGAGLRPHPLPAAHRGAADHGVHGRAGDLPAARRPPDFAATDISSIRCASSRAARPCRCRCCRRGSTGASR